MLSQGWEHKEAPVWVFLPLLRFSQLLWICFFICCMLLGQFPETSISYTCIFYPLKDPFTGDKICWAPYTAIVKISDVFDVMLICYNPPHPLQMRRYCLSCQFLTYHILLPLLDSWSAKMRKWQEIKDKVKTPYQAHLSEAPFSEASWTLKSRAPSHPLSPVFVQLHETGYSSDLLSWPPSWIWIKNQQVSQGKSSAYWAHHTTFPLCCLTLKCQLSWIAF